MIAYVFYAVVAVTVLVALQDWRAALYLCILLDFVRDPVRKLAADHSVWITQSVSVVWLAIAVGVLSREHLRLAVMARRHPQLQTAAKLLCLSLLPGAVVAIINFEMGWKLALLGAASYLAVIPGILVGYAFPRSTADISRFMTFYCVVNSVGLISGVAEYLHWGWPALGGIEMTWLRYRPGYTVELISGFYRSPDILGLHAAGACLFAMVLAIAGRRQTRVGWYLLVIGSAVLLLLAGRRKMVGIPLVFVASFVYLMLRRTQHAARSVQYVMAGAGALVVVFIFAAEIGVSGKYTTYASSIWTEEGAERSGLGLFNSPLGTLEQSGLLGRGLGSATQGNYHFAEGRFGWQEDGGGKLFAELGLPGVVLFGFAAWLLVRTCGSALRLIPAESRAFRLQAGLMSVVAGNVASFIVSHQAYSGDPTSVCFVLFCLGGVLALPEIVSASQPVSRVPILRQAFSVSGV